MDLAEYFEEKRKSVQGCCGIKVYFLDKDNYCIKYLGENGVIKRTQKGKMSDKMDNGGKRK